MILEMTFLVLYELTSKIITSYRYFFINKIHTLVILTVVYLFKDIDRSFLYIFLIKKFHRNIVFFAYESIYHWKGNYIVLILVKILLKKISYFGCY